MAPIGAQRAADGGIAGPRQRRLPLAMPLLATPLLALAIYAPAMRSPLAFDDWHVISQNPAIRSLANIPAFFADASHFSILPGNQDYRPLHTTASAIAWAIGGGASWPFHLIGVLAHAATALLLAATLLGLTAAAPDTAGWSQGQRRAVAAGAALLLLVHPLASQTVIYASAQGELLAAMFMLAAIAAFVTRHGQPDGAPRLGLLALVCYALALLSKPAAIALPLLLLLWEVLLGPQGLQTRMPLLLRIRAIAWRQLPWWLVSAAYLGLRTQVTRGPLAGGGAAHGRGEWLMTQLEALFRLYGRLALAPTDLNVDREYPLVESAASGRFLLAALLAVLVGWACWALRQRRPLLVLLLLWFPAAMALTSFVVVLGQVVTEHRAYLSLAGFCGAVSLVAVELVRRRPSRRALVAGAGLLVALALAAGTVVRSRVWASSLDLWADAAASDGTWRASMNYGLELEEAGRPEEAMAAFEKAVVEGPYAFAFLNRGLAHLRRSNVAAGIADLEHARTLWPSSPDVLGHYGWGLAVAGRTAEAEQALRSSLELRPDFPRALGWLAWVLESQARWSEAVPLRERLLALDGSEANRSALERTRARANGTAVAASTDSRRDLVLQTGLAAVVDGRFEEGARLLEGVRPQLPPRADLLFSLGFAQQKLERHDAAREAYRALLEIDPRHVRGTFNLAFELLSVPAGPADLERSVELFRRVRELDPGNGEALFREASALRALGRNGEADLLDAQYLRRADAHPELRRVAAGRLAARASAARAET